MTNFSSELEESLHRALERANLLGHRISTTEHLLEALIEDSNTRKLLHACDVDIQELKQKLSNYIEDSNYKKIDEEKYNEFIVEKKESKDTDEPTPAEEAQPSSAFKRVIHRAVVHVQSSGREVVEGSNVVVALFAERESYAAIILQEQDMTRYDAVNYLSHGIAKRRFEDVPPSPPRQNPAPLEVQWENHLLVALNRSFPSQTESNKKGQKANFDKLSELLKQLDGDSRGANAAPEICEAVAAYREALGKTLEALHGFNVGFAGLVLADTFRAAADDLSDGYKGKVQALLTLNDHLVSQDPEWADYVSDLRASKITLQADEEAEQSADDVISAFEDLTEVISPAIATRLRALRRSANRVRQIDPKVLKPLWDSFENTLRALGARVVEEWAAGSEDVSEAVGILQDQLGAPLAKGGKKALDLGKKVVSDVGKETYKKLVQFSGAGGALYILWLAYPQLLKISQTLGFTWLEHLLNFIRTVAGG